MGSHTGVTRGRRGGGIFQYLEREFREGVKAAEARGLTAYLSEGGTAKPSLAGTGLSDFGLSIGMEIASEQAESIWGELCNPFTGEPYGQKLARYPGMGELLCKAAEGRGVELPEELAPEHVRKAVVAGRVSDQAINRRMSKLLKEELPADELREMRAEARRAKKQEARPWLGFTTSVSKDAALLHAAFLARGRVDEAHKVMACLYKAVDAQVALVEARVGSNKGRGGLQAIDATRLAALVYPHMTSRAGDPQPHLHVHIANRTLCDDGKWRALNGKAFFELMPLVAETGARVLTRRWPVPSA